MSGSEGKRLPDDVERLLRDHIDSVRQLEVLLILRSESSRDWSPEEMSQETRTSRESVEADLKHFRLVGLAETSGGARGSRYRYAPASAELRQTVDALATAYATRKQTVIRLVLAGPSDTIQTFADAFRLRRKRDW